MKRLMVFAWGLLLLASCSSNGDYSKMTTTSNEDSSYGWTSNLSQESTSGFGASSTAPVIYEESTETSKESGADGFQNKGGQEENDTRKKTKSKIIKEGEIGIQVKDYYQARNALDSVLGKYKAYIADENERKSRYSIENRIIIRMPAEYFDTFVGEIGSMASKVDYKRVTAKDVTRQYVDIESRLNTKKGVRKKYESFLVNAKNVEEMLAIEEKVRMLTEEIEAKEAELRFLSDKVSFSTVTLNMNQRLKYGLEEPDYVGPNFFQKLSKAFSNGWSGFLGLIIGITTVWPIILIGIVIFLAIRKPTRSFLKRLFKRS